MGWMFDNAGRLIAWLQKPANHREPFAPNDSTALRDTLRPGDVLLVEGKGRISGSIKYLTQSTWSHSALYVGPKARSRREITAEFPDRALKLRNAHAVSDMGISTLSWIERGRDGELGGPSALPLSVASRIYGR